MCLKNTEVHETGLSIPSHLDILQKSLAVKANKAYSFTTHDKELSMSNLYVFTVCL
jgi:hypothetical protein